MLPEDFYRWSTLALLLAALSISGTYRRRAQRRNGGISRRVDGDFFALASAFVMLISVSSVLFYLISPRWMAWGQMPIHPAWRWLGLALAGLAIPGIAWLFHHLGDNVSPTAAVHDRHSLVTSGPYQWVRHPLYTFGTLFWLGLGLALASWWQLLLTTAVIPFLGKRIPREEAALIERFGDAYEQYRRRTGRFLPHLRALE